MSLDPERLSDVAERTAAALNAEIYGVDAVVTSSGEVVSIDMNDWPTIGRFRSVAGRVIADCLIGQFTSYSKTQRQEHFLRFSVLKRLP